MQLTRFTDFSLRCLLYLAGRPGEIVPTTTISAAYNISQNHVAKAVKTLTKLGYLEATRGSHGGVKLRVLPRDIRVGDVIRECEPHLDLLECFTSDSRCPLATQCMLENLLREARDAFMTVADSYTLQDMLEGTPALMQLLPPTRQTPTDEF